MNYLFGGANDEKDPDNHLSPQHRSTVSTATDESSASLYAEDHDAMDQWLRENADLNIEEIDVNSPDDALAAKSKQAVLRYIEAMVDEQVSLSFVGFTNRRNSNVL
jgi:hypothetical protein